MVATPLMCVYCQISSLYIDVIIKFLLIHSIVHQKLRNFDALLFARKHFVPKGFSIKENFQTSLLEVIKNGWCVQVERSHLIWQRRAAWKRRCQIRFLPDQWRNFTAHNNSNFLIFRYLCQLQVHQHHFLCLFVLLFAFAHHLSFAYLSHWWGCESFSMWFYIGHFRQFFVYFGTFNDNTKFLHTNVKNVRLAFELIATKPVVISLCLSSNECFISVSWSSFYFFLLHLFWFCLCL